MIQTIPQSPTTWTSGLPETPASFLGPSEKIPTPSPSLFLASGEVFNSEIQNFLQGHDAAIQQALNHPPEPVLNRLAKVNEKRRRKGMAALDLSQVNAKLEEIYRQSGLTDQEKKKEIEDLRKELKLSKGDMKALFTRPIADIFERAAQSLELFRKEQEERLQSQREQAEKIFGKTSREVKDIKEKQALLSTSILPREEAYGRRGNFFKGLYPSFWSKFKGFFKKIGNGIKKGFGVLVKVVPGLKTLVTSLTGIIRPLHDLFQGKFVSFFKNLGTGLLQTFGEIPKLAGLIPGIGTAANWIGQGIKGIQEVLPGSSKSSSPQDFS